MMDDGIYTPGTMIDGRYRIEARLGRGGFATVYRAEAVRLGRPAALKVLEPVAPHISARFRERFNTEAKIAANLDHPNVVRIFDFGFIEGDDRPYMAMELLEGRDLEAYLEQAGPMDPERARRLFLGVLDALRIGHERGIVHKDLKPSNLFFVKEGAPDEKLVILDYGIARLEGDANPRFTEEGTYTGTPAYMPPEYIHRREVTPAYDVYQIGLIFIEAMTGQPVVVAGSQIAYMVAHVEGRHRIPDGFGQTPLGATLVKAIAVDPRDRYATAGDMYDAVQIADVDSGTDFTLPAISLGDSDSEQLSTKRPTTTERDSLPPQSPRKSGVGIGVILLVLGLLGLASCAGAALLGGAWFWMVGGGEEVVLVEDLHHDPVVDPRAEPPPAPPQVPTMPRIDIYPEAGQEMHAWLLGRYMVFTTLNQVRLYFDILEKTGGWTAKGASFVPTGTEDLMGLGMSQIQLALDNAPARKALEADTRKLVPQLEELTNLLVDLYDYHSVRRGWEADKGANGKQLTKQLESVSRRVETSFQRWSDLVDKELFVHLANAEDEAVKDPFVQVATRAMIAEAKLITTMAKNPNSKESNDALSAFDKSLDAMEKHIRANRAALTERYQITQGLHDRFLSSLKDTRKQAGEIRAEVGKGDDVSGDVPFLWMQLHMTFDVYNQLQRF